MSTTILTPLFPPDPSNVALYTKILAEKLSVDDLSVIAYGNLPESVANTTIYPIDKRSSKFTLVWQCLKTLWQLQPDNLIVQNGPSSELPALIYSYLHRPKLILVFSDLAASQKQRSWLHSQVTKRLTARAETVVTLPTDTTTYLPLEWLPFTPNVEDKVETQKNWWQEHLIELGHGASK